MGQTNEGTMIKSRLTRIMGRRQEKTGKKLTYRALARELNQLATEVGLADKVRIDKDWLSQFDKDEFMLINRYKLQLLRIFFDTTLDQLLWETNDDGQTDNQIFPGTAASQ